MGKKEALKMELKNDLMGEIEDLRAALPPLYTVACRDSDEGEAGAIMLDMSEVIGDMRLTAYQIFRLLDELTDGTAQE